MPNRYTQIIESIFHDHYRSGDTQVPFARDEIQEFAVKLGVVLPKNLGDLIYSFRYRTALPGSLQATAPEGLIWIIKPAGRGLYQFELVKNLPIVVNPLLTETKIPDATPGVVAMYALGDEQALLARIRYNRLIDIFLGVTCYSLQNHLRTTVPEIGQVETDEIYVGLDRRGVHYVIPVQAKASHEKLGVIQIEQDVALCAHKFESLICRPIGAQFIENNFIALFEFEMTDDGVRLAGEKHYRLVLPEGIDISDLQKYQIRSPTNP